MFLISLLVLNLSYARITTYAEDIRTSVKDNHKYLKKCFDIALEKNPKLAGKVVMEWDIDDEGLVHNPVVISSNAKSPEMEACLKETLETLTLAPAPKKQLHHLRYPFTFGRFK